MVFVGGRMSLADGSELDSRQPMADAATIRASRIALTSSVEWWSVVSSIVLPTLDEIEGAFALLCTSRTIARATPDGEIRKSSLRRLLRGGIGTVSIQRTGPRGELPQGYRRVATLRSGQGEHMGDVGVRAAEGVERWRFLDGSEFYTCVVAERLGARAVVDAGGTFLTSAYAPLDVGSLSVEFHEPSSAVGPEFLILPDTVEMRERVEKLLAWRPREVAHADAPPVASPFAPAAPRDPDDFLRFAVVRSECHVTGLLRAGRWEEASDLEAARMLLLKRFDLKLGLWDLALNPVLRGTVLDPAPVVPAPVERGQASTAVRASSRREAARAMSRKDSSRSAVASVIRILHETLGQTGWRIKDGALWLPLTEPLATWPDGPKYPLVTLRVEINKGSARVVVWHSFYNDLDIQAFVSDRREAFEAIAAVPAGAGDQGSVRLWSADSGWGDETVDWSGQARVLAACTKAWSALLEEFVASCRTVRRSRFLRRV